MKLITRDSDRVYLDHLKRLFEDNGIPAFVGGENVARILPPVAMSQAGVWIYLDHQLDDARKLTADPGYRVSTGVDVEAFYENQPSEAAKLKLLNRALIHLALIVLAAGGVLFLLIWLLVRP